MQFALSFNPAVVEALAVREGNLFKQGGANTYFQPGNINNRQGKISNVAGVITTPGGEMIEAGIFAAITFRGKSNGITALELTNVIIGNKEGQAVPVTVSPCIAMVIAEPGASIKGYVKLEKVNPADLEPDNPRADHSGTQIKVVFQGYQVKASLSSQNGSYQITGLAGGLYELHYARPGWSRVERKNVLLLANETKEMSPLMLFIGDMNQDTYINVQDLLWMAAKIGLRPGQPGWEEAKIADVNKDTYLNVQDLLRVAKNIGVRPQ